MDDFVALAPQRNRGWPWPESSWGLTPMYGEDGWCHECGIPLTEQTGSVVLERRGLTSGLGVWMPNWRFDLYCADDGVVSRARAAGFRLDSLPIQWHGASLGVAHQLTLRVSSAPWFDPDELAVPVLDLHGKLGDQCPGCGTFRWNPLNAARLPAIHLDPADLDGDLIASPEWFGAGWRAFRQVIMRRDLAEFLQAEAPKDFTISEVVLREIV
jgi:hypothetical protein